MGLIALESLLAIIVQRPGPILKRNVFDLDIIRQVSCGTRPVDARRINRYLYDSGRCPDSLLTVRRSQIQSSVRPVWRRTGRRGWGSAALAVSPTLPVPARLSIAPALTIPAALGILSNRRHRQKQRCGQRK